MKRVFCALFGLIITLALAAQSSDKEPLRIVTQAVETIKQNAIKVEFTMNYSTATHQTNKMEHGTSVIYDDKFYFNMSGIESLYDGKTQWVYMADVNEVTITEPTADELKDMNPLAMVKYYLTNHRVTFDDPNGSETRWFINFYPHDKKAEYFRVAMQISKKSHYPLRITIFQKNGDKILFDWTKIYLLKNPNKNRFIFNKKDYPNVIVNDLR